MAKFSIILPVRNGGNYVKECVASVLSQQLTDFNFIILDNASTDGTLEWLQSINDERIKIIPSTKSLTIEENWGRVKDVTKNEFITLIGHDDILYPDFLTTIDRLIQDHPQASLYHTHFNFIDAVGKTIRPCKPMNNRLNGNEFLQAFLTANIDLMGTGYVMRSKDYDALEGIPVKYPNLLFADFELWLNLTLKSYEAIAPNNCFAFRVHKGTTGTSQDKKLHDALGIFVDYLANHEKDDVKAKNTIDEFGSQFLLFYCKGFSHRLLRTPLQKRNHFLVKDFVSYTKQFALKLGIQQQYKPSQQLPIQLALLIDSNTLSRKLFLFFKSIYSKPVM